MSEGKLKEQIFKLKSYDTKDKHGNTIITVSLTDTFKILDEARKEIFEAIDKHIEELVEFWQSKPDPQKQGVARDYIDAYRCIQHNVKEEDVFKLLKWFGSEKEAR